MRTRRTRTRNSAFAALAALTFVAAACGERRRRLRRPTAAPAATEPMTTEPMADARRPGRRAGAVPTDGEGSFAGMADDPAATAASNNPELSTLVAAVGAAGLVDTLNGAGPFTIFAPVNSAFEKIPAADLEAVLADTDLLTSILTYHVVPEQLSSAELAEAGTVTTVNGADLEIALDGDALSVERRRRRRSSARTSRRPTPPCTSSTPC